MIGEPAMMTAALQTSIEVCPEDTLPAFVLSGATLRTGEGVHCLRR
jgi:hypothetical protein